MIENYSRYRVLKEFFKNPTRNLQMREISRNTKISQPSIIQHLKALIKEGLVIRTEEGLYPSYKANHENKKFKSYKKNDLLLDIENTGLADYLDDKISLRVIVLFGSGARGEDTEDSDIDLYIEAPKTTIEATKYEKLLRRKIELHFKERISSYPKELRNNIANGIIIRGYLQIFK